MGPKPKPPADECVRVVVRLRPFNKREKDLKCDSVIDIDIDADTVRIQKPKTEDEANQRAFVFDAVYDDHSTQRAVYDETASSLVDSVLAGYNGTIFAYGQTGCGKTFSMEGMEEPKELRGIIPNAFDHIFDVVDADETARQYLIRASYLEIYNEEVRDLLGDDPVKKCDLHETPEKGVFVKGLTMGIVKTAGEIDSLMKAGNLNRTTGATLMNATSSRSHSIFQVTIETSEEQTDSKGKKSQSIKVGKLNLVDLAGSERQSKTEAKGERFKEATKINLSLSALGNVINALVEGKSKHIPYRDSKLTRLLQDSLGGNTKTVMLAAISPADNNYDETMSTLRYANRAKNIKNKPKINEDPKDALLREFQEEIERLRQMLEAQQSGAPMPAAPPGASPGKQMKKMKSQAKLEKQGSMAFLDSSKGAELKERESNLVRTAKEIEQEQAKLREKEELLLSKQKAMADNEKAIADEKARVLEKETEMKRKEEELAAKRAAIAEESAEMAKKIAEAVKQKDEAAKKKLETQLADLNAEKEAMAKATEEAQEEKGTLEGQLADMQSMVHSKAQAAEEAANRAAAAERAAQAAKRNEARERRRAQMKLEKQKAKEEMLRNEMEYLEQDKEMEKQEAAYLEDQAEMNEQLIKRIKKKYLAQKSEIRDLREEHQTEREYLTGQIRDQAREMALLEQIVSLFVPPKTLERLEKRARYDEENLEWVIPQDLIRDRTHVASASLKLPGMGDSRTASAPRQRRGSIALQAALNAADSADPGGMSLAQLGGLEQLPAGQVGINVVPSHPSPEDDERDTGGRTSENSLKSGARPSSGSRRPLTTATATPPHLRYLQEVEGRKRSASTVMAEGPALAIPRGPPKKGAGLLGQARGGSAMRSRSDQNGGGMTPSLPGLGPSKNDDDDVPDDAHKPSGMKERQGSGSPFVPIADAPPGAPVKSKRKEHKHRTAKAAASAEEEAYLEEGFEAEDPEEQAYLDEGFEDDPEAPKKEAKKAPKRSSSKRESTSRTSKRHGEKKSKKPAAVPGLNLGKAALDKQQGGKIPQVKGAKKKGKK